MGILGRRRLIPPVSEEGRALLERQLASPDPCLARMALEAQKLETRKSAAYPGQGSGPVTVVPFPGSQGIKTRRIPGPQSAPLNPDPTRLRWDAEKRAFRLRTHPAKCDCHGKRSSLTGEPLSCGLCDKRAKLSAGFQPDPAPPPCRYCGRPSAHCRAAQICTGCERMRGSIETGQLAQHSIAVQRGRTSPATIGDDELLVTITRRLRDADHRRLELDARDERKTKRDARRAKYAEPVEEAAA